MRAPQTIATRGRRRSAMPRLIAPALLALLIAPPDGAAQQPAGRTITFPQGWSAAERREFYHLSLGSEIFPVSWTRALTSVATRRPFLEGLDRFGFLDDPAGPGHLPIGLTAQTGKPDPSAKAGKTSRPTPMLGINCAACHVGELVHGGKTYRIDGAPNVLMDIIAFNAELADSVARIAEYPGDFAAFQLGVAASPEEAERIGASSPDVLKVLQALAAWDKKDGAHQMADGLAEALTPLFQPKTSSWPLVGTSITVMPSLEQPVTLEFMGPLEAIGKEAGPTIGAFLKANSGKGAPLGVLDPDPLAAVVKLETLTEEVVQHFTETVWYLKQTSVLMAKQKQLRSPPGRTDSGPGRVDDFRLARNLVAGNLAMAKPSTSPTSYPTLWGSNRVKWLGWDGNADSTMQRNIGTALAVGASFDPESGASSIPLEDVYRLEVVASKVLPPKWPFGSFDAEKVARGAVLYKKLCVACHVEPDAVPFTASGTLPDWLPDLLYFPASAPAAGRRAVPRRSDSGRRHRSEPRRELRRGPRDAPGDPQPDRGAGDPPEGAVRRGARHPVAGAPAPGRPHRDLARHRQIRREAPHRDLGRRPVSAQRLRADAV